MDNIVEGVLGSIEGFLLSITRNTERGWYELEVGIPSSWVFRGSKSIECTTTTSNDQFKIVKVSPQETSDYVAIDELIEFVSTIIKTNKEIAEKENGFRELLEKEKVALENRARLFLDELEALKEKSFTNFDENKHENVVNDKQEKKRIKKQVKADGKTETEPES